MIPVEGLGIIDQERFAALMERRRQGKIQRLLAAFAIGIPNAMDTALADGVGLISDDALDDLLKRVDRMSASDLTALADEVMEVARVMRSVADQVLAHPEGGIHVAGLLVAADWTITEMLANGFEINYGARYERADGRAVFAVGDNEASR